jgi:hypothetical protein
LGNKSFLKNAKWGSMPFEALMRENTKFMPFDANKLTTSG